MSTTTINPLQHKSEQVKHEFNRDSRQMSQNQQMKQK